MGRPKRSKSAPFLSTAAVNVKKVNKSKIQLVSVLNPRVLYYLEELVRPCDYLFDVEELVGTTISEPLLDICVGMLSDDNFVSKKLQQIPSTKINNIAQHIETAFSQLPNGLTFYSPFLNVETTSGKDGEEYINLNWILHNVLWGENPKNGCYHWWENYYDEFHGGNLPTFEDTQSQAERMIKSPFFISFLKRNPNFLKTDACNVKSAILLTGLYDNPQREFDPYSDPRKPRKQQLKNEKNSTNFTVKQQIDNDFKLESVLTNNFRENGKILQSEEIIAFHEKLSELVLINWREEFEVAEEYIANYPFGLLYKEVVDGRYERMLQYFNRALPQKNFQKLIRKIYEKYFDELRSFNRDFNEFIENRENPEYRFDEPDNFLYFSSHNLSTNADFEELTFQLFNTIIPFTTSQLNIGTSNESLLDIIFRVYKEYATLNIKSDISECVNDNDSNIISELRQGSEFTRGQLSVQKKIVLMTRSLIQILAAMFNYQPRFGLSLSLGKLLKLVRIMADWKIFFSNECAGIYTLYYTELTIRTIGQRMHRSRSTKIVHKSKKSSKLVIGKTKGNHKANSKKTKKIFPSSSRKSLRIRKRYPSKRLLN